MVPTQAATSTPGPARDLYVVGVGASAGGLEALERFFTHVPLDSGMAFVVVQHLSPDFKSMMDELLARRTALPIHLVENGMPVEANHVYLIPPKKEMIISGGRLLLSERDRQQELSLPIDVFFRSLAQDCGERSAAVVLSGGGSDGSRGIRDVHEAGGIVLVQDLESAQFAGMPKAAVDAGVADAVMPPDEMPAALVEHVRFGRDVAARPEGPLPPQGLGAIYRMLESEFGLDFTHYKPSTVTRRIERRLQLSRAGDLAGYVERLRDERAELDVLYRDLLIGVTRFFRNEEAFAVLERQVLPELLAAGPRDAPFRAWVAGCATGEEAYSLAIVLHELTARVSPRPVKIFATDVHPGSLEFAARAVYDEAAIAAVSPERRDRYFVRHGHGYQVVPELRQMIVFAPHNVIKDAPFTRVDLVSCRNLLIYLQPPAQQKALGLFHFALNRGGVVFLGPSESQGALAREFEVVDAHWRIYRKFSDGRFPVDARQPPPRPAESRTLPPAFTPRPPMAGLLGTYDALLDEFVPPSLLLTERGELVHAFAGASRFLKPRDGRQALDVLENVLDELKMVIAGGLRRARKDGTPVVYKGVPVEGDGSPYDITVRPVGGRGGGAGHVLVSFESAGGPAAAPRAVEAQIDVGDVSREQLGVLEAELSATKENLQAAIEELETSNEELQAANEELLASNEELQSTNEELQSVNEELYTVNAEYQRKLAELVELTNDMDNLLASTDVGVIFLDAELRIRKFTPRVGDVFRLLPQDVGRPIETFTHSMHHPELVGDLRRVLASGSPVEREVRHQSGSSFFVRVLPYRAKGAVDGVVLTLIDVSGMKAAEDALFHERYLLNSLLDSVPDAIYFKDVRGKLIRLNRAMAARLGVGDPAEAVGKTPFELPDRDAALAVQHNDEAVLRGGEAEHYRLERRALPDGAEGWDLVTRLPLVDRRGGTVGVIGIFRDVTEQKRAEEKIHEAVRRRDQFLAMLSHELRNPLGAIVTATALLKSADEPDTRRKVFAIFERQSQQMARLLDDLLDASRVTQNKIELRKAVLDLRTVARDAADATRPLMEARGLSFSIDLGARPLHVEGDAVRLQQIHANLLSNAAKYTPRGGHVRLELAREGGRAIVRVKDDGVGIPADVLGSVFDLFVQSSRTLDRSDGGLGLGLTLVRSLVAMHGGEVTVRSDGEGKGSEFVVRLPLAPASSVAAGEGEAAFAARGGARKVVIVEDNADSREMMCQFLGIAGFECHSAGDGIAGLTLIERMRPDVALIDVGLPGIDGFEIARRVRGDARHDHLYLIAVTGYGQPSDRAQAVEAGFDAHVVKPVQPESLVRLLSRDRSPGGNGDGAGRAHRPTTTARRDGRRPDGDGVSLPERPPERRRGVVTRAPARAATLPVAPAPAPGRRSRHFGLVFGLGHEQGQRVGHHLEHEGRARPGDLAVGGDLDAPVPARVHGEPAEAEPLDVLGVAERAERPAQRQDEHRPRADRAHHDRGEAPAVEIARLVDADALELQPVVAHEQGGGAQRSGLAFGLDVEAELPPVPEQRREAREHRHEAAAPEALLVRLALFENLGVEAHAAVDQEQAAVDHARLHRLDMRPEQRARLGLGVLGYAVGPAEQVEGALRHHAEATPAAVHGARDAIDRAVAPGGDHHAALAPRAVHGLFGAARQVGGVLDQQKVVLAPRLFEHPLHDGAGLEGVVVARARVHHDEERALRAGVRRHWRHHRPIRRLCQGDVDGGHASTPPLPGRRRRRPTGRPARRAVAPDCCYVAPIIAHSPSLSRGRSNRRSIAPFVARSLHSSLARPARRPPARRRHGADRARPHSSRMATARIHPALAALIFTGKHESTNPLLGSCSSPVSFSIW
jgi:two-component system, chemotaxis family, CheB/CheR fusion protein